MFQKKLYSIQSHSVEMRSNNPYYGMMTTYLVGGNVDCRLFDFCYNFFLEYLKHFDFIIDGHWINIAFRFAYEYYPDIKKDIDSIGINNANPQDLIKIINSPVDEQQLDSILGKQIFHKMNWRIKYVEILDGRETTYCYLMKKL